MRISKNLKENEIGGAFLMAGALMLLTTIYFEYSIGWIGVDRNDSDIPLFMYDNWQSLSRIWTWQMLSHFIFIIACLLLIKNANAVMRLLWSVLMLCSLMMLIAFGLTLGSYYPALENYDTQPALFDTVRGGIGYLYSFGRYGLLVFVFVFLVELLNKNGKVNRVLGFSCLTLIIVLIISGSMLGISLKITGASFFFIPLIIGYFYLKNKD